MYEIGFFGIFKLRGSVSGGSALVCCCVRGRKERGVVEILMRT